MRYYPYRFVQFVLKRALVLCAIIVIPYLIVINIIPSNSNNSKLDIVDESLFEPKSELFTKDKYRKRMPYRAGQSYDVAEDSANGIAMFVDLITLFIILKIICISYDLYCISNTLRFRFRPPMPLPDEIRNSSRLV